VRAGEVSTAVVDPVLPVVATAQAATARKPEKRSTRWKLWLGVGIGAAVVVAGAVAIGVVASSSSSHNFWMQASSSCQAPCQVADFR
jgi:hypothetical protein